MRKARRSGGDARAPADAGLSREQNRVGVIAVTLPLVPEHDALTSGHPAAHTGPSSAARSDLTENRPKARHVEQLWRNFFPNFFQIKRKLGATSTSSCGNLRVNLDKFHEVSLVSVNLS